MLVVFSNWACFTVFEFHINFLQTSLNCLKYPGWHFYRHIFLLSVRNAIKYWLYCLLGFRYLSNSIFYRHVNSLCYSTMCLNMASFCVLFFILFCCFILFNFFLFYSFYLFIGGSMPLLWATASFFSKNTWLLLCYICDCDSWILLPLLLLTIDKIY